LQDQIEGCCGDVADLQALVDAVVEDAGGECEVLSDGILTTCASGCVNTDTDEASCGACVEDGGAVCEPGEECVDGGCEVIPCPAPAGDPNFECNEAVRNEDGTCTYVVIANKNGDNCDDNRPCTGPNSEKCNNGTCLSNGNTPCDTGETCAEESDAPGGYVCVPDND